MDIEKILSGIAVLIIAILIGFNTFGQSYKYPNIQPKPAIDYYYGEKVVDEFRNLEDTNDRATLKWYKDQKKFFDEIFNNIPQRDSIKAEIIKYNLNENISVSYPQIFGNQLFYVKYHYNENYEELILRNSLEGSEKVLLSTESLNSENKTYEINYLRPSHAARYIAYGISSNGSEIAILKVYDIENNNHLPIEIKGALVAKPTWLPDDRGFLYKQLKEPNLKSGDDGFYEDRKIKLHLLGTNTEEDPIVFSRLLTSQVDLERIDIPQAYTYKSSDKIFIAVNKGSEQHRTLYMASIKEVLTKKPQDINWKELFSNEDKLKLFTVKDHWLYSCLLNTSGKNIIHKMNLNKQTDNSIIYEGKEDSSIQEIGTSKNFLFMISSTMGRDELVAINNSGEQRYIDVDGKLYYISTYTHSDSVLFGIASWKKHFNIDLYAAKTDSIYETNLLPQYKNTLSDSLVVKEIDVKGHDGELIPLTVIYKKGIQFNGQNPTIIYAYGAYGYSIDPYFDTSFFPWYDRGGIYAVAHVRGGGEKGERWYKAGFKATKENSWKDLISCAEFLLKSNYTSSDHLAAYGSSAGAITIGKAITERPQLFKAAGITVGALNIIRMENTGNTSNVPEFGTVKDSLEFQYLYEMDVYHHIEKRVKYPAFLFTASLNDPRLEAWQPGKVVAKLQTSKAQNNIVLFRVQESGGHSGSSFQDYSEEMADTFSFFFWQLGHPDFINVTNLK